MPTICTNDDGNHIDYTYTDGGVKLRVDYYLNPYTPAIPDGEGYSIACDSSRLVHTWREYAGGRVYDNGVLMGDSRNTGLQPYKYIGKEYASCGDDPVNAFDPDGNSTWVTQKGENKYEIVGGDINDKDRNIYVGMFNDKGTFVPIHSIGITTSITSFYDSDADGGGQWSIGSIIDTSDKSGDNFLSRIISENPSMIEDYMRNARNGHKYDFKSTNGTDKAIKGIDIYRGMPIGSNGKGQTIFSSARDIGNMAAGYVAGVNGMPWEASRIAFDTYQNGIEGISTRNAEYYGWVLGYNSTNNNQKIDNLMRSISTSLSALWKLITK